MDLGDLKSHIPTITVIIGTLFLVGIAKILLSVIKDYRNRRMLQVQQALEAGKSVGEIHPSFNSSFIQNDFKELYFAARTKIQTTHQRIDQLTNLKKTLDGAKKNYSWRSFRLAMDNFNFEQEEIRIVIKTYDSIVLWILNILGWTTFIIGTGLITWISFELQENPKLPLILLVLIPSFLYFVIMFFSMGEPVRIAKRIDSDLNHLKEE